MEGRDPAGERREQAGRRNKRRRDNFRK